jgi:hypothetical protein
LGVADVFTSFNFGIAIVAALVGYILFESSEKVLDREHVNLTSDYTQMKGWLKVGSEPLRIPTK